MLERSYDPCNISSKIPANKKEAFDLILKNVITKNIGPRASAVFEASLCAARAGLGVALAILPISAHELRSGRLQALTDQPLECRAGFYFVSKPNDHKRKDYERVNRWLCGVFAAL